MDFELKTELDFELEVELVFELKIELDFEDRQRPNKSNQTHQISFSGFVDRQGYKKYTGTIYSFFDIYQKMVR